MPVFKLPQNFLNDKNIESDQKKFESSRNNSTTNIKSKIKLQIEMRFQKSQSNLTYKFPLKKENMIMNYNDDSLDSLKELTIYNLREQNNKENNRNLTKNGFLKDSFEKSKEKINNYIKGKYQILKGKSLLHGGEMKNSSNFVEFSYQGQQKKLNKHGKNQSGSSDLKSSMKSQMFQTNPLYKLAQDNLTLKRKLYKGLSNNFVGLIKKNEVICLKNALSNTFLEINSMKVSIPIMKTSNSFKITSKK